MKESILVTKSKEFAVDIIKLVKLLQNQKEFIISNQIGRSGTSIGANIHEANYGQSKADFLSKMQIALKETNETMYWLELLLATDYINQDKYNDFYGKLSYIKTMLVKTCNTAKE